MTDITTSAPVAPIDTPAPSAEEIAAHGPAVDAMLAAAGIAIAGAERRSLLEMYAIYQPAIAALYALPEVRYEAPALVFQAAPKLDAWGA
jgi:hypothetical protein